MISIFYEVGCHDCLQHDGMQRMYTLMDGNLEVYKNKREYEVVTLIEKWIREDNHRCNSCGSTHLEVHDVSIDRHPLYDYDRLMEKVQTTYEPLFFINIDKRGTNLIPRIQKTSLFESHFEKLAIEEIIKLIKTRPDSNFIPHTKGNFFIALSASYLTNPHIRIERFTNQGIGRDEIFKIIKPFAEQYNLEQLIHHNAV